MLMIVLFIMAYLDIPREFFIKACAIIQSSHNKDRNFLYMDLDNKFILRDGERIRGHFTMFCCEGFDDKNKDIIEFCYECFKNNSAKYHDPDCKYGFDGENFIISTKCQPIG
jgi:hypothetical protein